MLSWQQRMPACWHDTRSSLPRGVRSLPSCRPSIASAPPCNASAARRGSGLVRARRDSVERTHPHPP